MSSWPSLSASKTPAASKTLFGLMSCFFHFGSPARADERLRARMARTARVVRVIEGMGAGLQGIPYGRFQIPDGSGQRAAAGLKRPGQKANEADSGSRFISDLESG